MSLNVGSSSYVSNDEIIRDISYHGDLKENSLFESKEVLSKCFGIIEVKNNFQFRKYIYEHDCSLNTSCHMHASSTVIDNCLIDEFRFMSTDRFIPKAIVHKACTNLGVNIS